MRNLPEVLFASVPTPMRMADLARNSAPYSGVVGMAGNGGICRRGMPVVDACSSRRCSEGHVHADV